MSGGGAEWVDKGDCYESDSTKCPVFVWRTEYCIVCSPLDPSACPVSSSFLLLNSVALHGDGCPICQAVETELIRLSREMNCSLQVRELAVDVSLHRSGEEEEGETGLIWVSVSSARGFVLVRVDLRMRSLCPAELWRGFGRGLQWFQALFSVPTHHAAGKPATQLVIPTAQLAEKELGDQVIKGHKAVWPLKDYQSV